MTFKYFYVLDDYLKEQGKYISYKNCDCPIDSYILESLKETKIRWTKLTKKEYEELQDKISNSEGMKDSPIGNLLYDFNNWKRKEDNQLKTQNLKR